ncbi:MAG TPA: hypothetical protein VEP49_18645 [Acidimicrobiia bacterium]|nr:hypothetical protein [Acidimicrobiia bacterium]
MNSRANDTRSRVDEPLKARLGLPALVPDVPDAPDAGLATPMAAVVAVVPVPDGFVDTVNVSCTVRAELSGPWPVKTTTYVPGAVPAGKVN